MKSDSKEGCLSNASRNVGREENGCLVNSCNRMWPYLRGGGRGEVSRAVPHFAGSRIPKNPQSHAQNRRAAQECGRNRSGDPGTLCGATADISVDVEACLALSE